MVSEQGKPPLDEMPVTPGCTAIPSGKTEGVGAESLKLGYEASGVSVRGLGIFLVIFILSAVFINVVVWFLTVSLLDRERNSATARSAVAPIDRMPEPPLQPMEDHDSVPWQDLLRLKTSEGEIFHRMGWETDAHGEPRVPDRIVRELQRRPLQTISGPATNAYEIPYRAATQPLGVTPAFGSETNLTPLPYAPAAGQRTLGPVTAPGGE